LIDVIVVAVDIAEVGSHVEIAVVVE